jgi:hypothetical protein
MDKRLGALLGMFFLSATLFITVVFFNKPIAKFTRAKEDFLPSIANSLILAFPLTVKADGAAESTISVFIRSDKGIPIKEQSVMVTASLGDLKESVITTNDQGKATFQLTSTKPGIANIEAVVGGTLQLNQKLSVKFE